VGDAGGAAGRGCGGEVRKGLLFSEEKRSKKDFPLFCPRQPGRKTDKSFLVLFFKKEHASLP
jgi:hypothetical protein